MESRKTDLSKFSNDWYNPGPTWKIVLWYLTNVVFFQNPLLPGSSIKVFILRCFGAKIGKCVVIKPSVNIKYPWFLSIGNHVWIGEKVWIDCLGTVKIGSNVCISQGALILSGNHHYKKETFDLIIRDIVLEDGVWIGARCVVTQGVVCRSHSLLTVGSVANRTLEPYSIYQGNPAIKIRDRVIS